MLELGNSIKKLIGAKKKRKPETVKELFA